MEAIGGAMNAASAYYGGRAYGYQSYQPIYYPQHGTMNTFIGGQPGFINY